MTIIRNPNYVEGAVVESRIGWWHFLDEPYARKGSIGVHTREPVEPPLIIVGSHPTGGEFLGWERSFENREAGFPGIPVPVPRGDDLALLTPEDLNSFKQIPDRRILRLEQAQAAGIIPRTASEIEEAYKQAAAGDRMSEIRSVPEGEDGSTFVEHDCGNPVSVGEPSSLPPHPHDSERTAHESVDYSINFCLGTTPGLKKAQEQGSLDSAWMQETLEEIFDLHYKCERGGIKETTFFSKLRNMAEEFEERVKKRVLINR